MTELDAAMLIARAEDRGEEISPILPRANWITLKGNFTPEELRAIATKIEESFDKGKTRYGN